MASTSIPAPSRTLVRAPRRLLALRTDDVLVDRVRAGDPIAFEVLYARHVRGVLGFCRHMLGDAEEAEDAVQTTFASAHRDLTQGVRDINFKPWLYTIARNRCISVLRARRETADAEPELQTAGLSEEVQQRADIRELVSDLHDLPPDQRAALVLTELGALSQSEVAEVLGCKVSNVKGLVFRARAGLIERRDARDASCEEIRVELANARRGGLRRGRLRHHVNACPGCAAYLADMKRQRQMLLVALPVVPTLGLKDSVLAAAGLGGAGGAGAVGGGLGLIGAGSTVAKVAVVGALVGGAGVAAPPAVERLTGDNETSRPPAVSTPAGDSVPRSVPSKAGAPPAAPAEKGAAGERGRARKVRRRGAGTPGATAPGREQAARAKAKAKAKGAPPAKARRGGRPAAPPAPKARRPAVPPGQTRAKPKVPAEPKSAVPQRRAASSR